MASHAKSPVASRVAHIQKLVGFPAGMAFAAIDLGMLSAQDKLGSLSVIKAGRHLPLALRMTVLASWWTTKRVKSSLVPILLFMARAARTARCFFSQFLLVTVPALRFSVGASKRKFGSLVVVKRIASKGTLFGGMAPGTTLCVKKHAFVGREMASGIAAVTRFASF